MSQTSTETILNIRPPSAPRALWSEMLNLAQMDRFLPAIMSVIYDGISPTQALAAAMRRAEGELHSRRRLPTETQDTVRRRFMNN